MSDTLSSRRAGERARLGFDIAEPAKLRGASTEAARLWDKGARSPSVHNLTKAHELGFDIIYVLTGGAAHVAGSSAP